MNKLNALYRCFPYPARRFWKNIPFMIRAFRRMYDRITKGYCESDLFDLDEHLLDLLSAMIRDLRDNLHSYPDEYGFEGWKDYLTEMANHFEMAHAWFDEEPDIYKNKYTEEFREMTRMNPKFPDIREKYLNREREIQKIKDEELRQGLEMLRKEFHHLWD